MIHFKELFVILNINVLNIPYYFDEFFYPR